jgi:hypothetical protein
LDDDARNVAFDDADSNHTAGDGLRRHHRLGEDVSVPTVLRLNPLGDRVERGEQWLFAQPFFEQWSKVAGLIDRRPLDLDALENEADLGGRA